MQNQWNLRRRERRGLPWYVCLASVSFAIVCFLWPTAAEAKKKPPAAPLDLNTATVEQLHQLPGIGPTTAKAIVRFREKSGPFQRVEDLLAIRGITKKRLEKLRPYVTILPAVRQKPGPVGWVFRASRVPDNI